MQGSHHHEAPVSSRQVDAPTERTVKDCSVGQCLTVNRALCSKNALWGLQSREFHFGAMLRRMNSVCAPGHAHTL
eukprot:scaffold84815_cov14-Tisochrysis_lutea.AAC.1